MQHLENDMDELFKRASENYPLQNGRGDWESIAKRLGDESNSTTFIVPHGRKINNKNVVFCLLLFFLLDGWFMFPNPLADKVSGIAGSKSATGNGAELTKEADKPSIKPAIKHNYADIDREAAINMALGKNKINNHKKKIFIPAPKASAKLTGGISDAFFYSNNHFESSNGKKSKTDPLIEKIHNYNNFSSPLQYSKETPGKEHTNNKAPISEPGKSGYAEYTDNKKEDDNPVTTQNKNRETPTILYRERVVYVGLVAGTDFSRVQSRPFNNLGFVAGLLAGYQLNKKLSLETGIIWNNKKYSSEGRSFNMNKVRSTMPQGMIINNLESNSSLIEIPLKARYYFIVRRNTTFFVAGGMSAYIMTREKNRYNVTMNGTQEKMMGMYDKNNYALPAIVNISMGYEHYVSKYIGIRIEPFLKIPVQGIGIGNLPVTSAGLQIGITSQLK